MAATSGNPGTRLLSDPLNILGTCGAHFLVPRGDKAPEAGGKSTKRTPQDQVRSNGFPQEEPQRAFFPILLEFSNYKMWMMRCFFPGRTLELANRVVNCLCSTDSD